MSDENENHGIKAKIVVSGKEEIDKLTKENQRLNEQLKIISMKEFELAKQKHNAPSDIETMEELEDFIKSEKEIEDKLKAKEEEEKNRNPATPTASGHAASGKAPLSGEPSGQISHVKEYENYAEMMEDVNQRTHSSDPEVRAEALEIQKQLLEKFAKDKKIHDFEVEIDLVKLAEEKRKAGVDAYNKAEEAGK